MKHLWDDPNRIHGGASRVLWAAALLSMAGWAASSHAETDAAADSKKSDADDLQEVTVVGYKITRGSVGSLVDAPVIDIPRNLDVITPETLENQMVSSTLDILKNWAGVQRGQATPGGEHPIVRGTTAYQFLEGSFSGGAIWDAAEFLGSAELMTGPDSVQYGFLVQGGGAINYRLKRPEAGEYLDVTAQGNNWGNNKYVFDANKSFNDGYADDGVRVIGAHESIQDFRKGTKHGERNSIGAMVTYSGLLGIKMELDAELLRRDAPAPEIIQFSANPAGPLPNINPRNSTEQPWEDITRDGYHLGAKLSRDLVGTWRAVAYLADESEKVINKSCTLFDPNVITGEGAFGCNTFGFETYSNRSLRLDLLGSFETFGIKHDVTVGAAQLRQFIELPPSFDTYGAAPYTANNLYDPRYYAEPFTPTSQSIFNQYRETQWWTQEYFQDRIQFGHGVDLWLGLNEGNNKVVLYQVQQLLAETKTNGLSPSFSLSYSPKDKLRFYVTYADAISPGGQAPISPQYVNSGERFGAMRLKSYEAGVKWQVADVSELNVNLFKADQPLAYIQVIAPNEFLYIRNVLRATQALGDVLAGDLDMDATGMGTQRPVHLEESLHFVDYVVEVPGLVTVGRLVGVAVHRIALPDHLVPGGLDLLDDRRAAGRAPCCCPGLVTNVSRPGLLCGSRRSTYSTASSGVIVGPILTPIGLAITSANATWAPSSWRVRAFVFSKLQIGQKVNRSQTEAHNTRLLSIIRIKF